MFHVKQGPARAPARDRSAARSEPSRRSRCRAAPIGSGGRTALAAAADVRRPASVSAAGVMPSMRPAWPMVRGRMRLQLLPDFVGQARQRRVVELVGQLEAFVAPIGCDVGGLAVQIDGVFGVDLELLRRSSARARASCGQIRATLGQCRGSDRTAARRRVRRWPSLVQRKAVPRGFVRRDRERSRQRARRIERRHLGLELALPRRRRRSRSRCPCRSAAGRRCRRASVSRYSAREVNIRYGSVTPRVDQIVDHHAEIAFGAVEDDRRRRRRPARPR